MTPTSLQCPDPQWPDPQWNATEHPFDQRATLPGLLQSAAARHRDRPALVTDEGVWCSHGELDQQAHQLARLLIDCGVGPGTAVALVGHHQPETIVAMVAVGIAGASYVPIDPSWPDQRVAAVLAITHAPVVVGRRCDLGRVGAWSGCGLTHVVVTDSREPSLSVPAPPVVAVGGFPAAAEGVAEALLGIGARSVLQLGLDDGELFERLHQRVGFFCGLDSRPEAVAHLAGLAQRCEAFADFTTSAFHAAHTRQSFDAAVFAAAQHTEVTTTLTALASVIADGGHAVVVAPGLRRPADLPRGWQWADACVASGLWMVRRDGDPVEYSGVQVRTAWHVERQSRAPLQPLSRPDDLAYTIFTSGSTGQPKGVAVAHRAVVNLIEWMTAQWSIGVDDQVLLVTSFSFDLSVYDVFGLLAVGGSVRLLDDECLAEPSRIAEALCDGEVTVWDSAPAALAWVVPFVSGDLARTSSLRLVILSGDWIPVSMPDELRGLFPDLQIAAQGGATEAAVWSNFFDVRAVDPQWVSIPYGRPIHNARYYVLGPDAAEVAVGEPGDLFIAGECLAAGYWANPRQTASRFVADLRAPGERMYATGDRARWRPDGTLQFLGRVDHQVKIRGYRVELGEIESALSTVAGIRAAVVVPVATGSGPVLAAFFTHNSTAAVSGEELASQLRQTLPPYMIPHLLSAIPTLPLTANGKIDRPELVSQAERQLARS